MQRRAGRRRRRRLVQPAQPSPARRGFVSLSVPAQGGDALGLDVLGGSDWLLHKVIATERHAEEKIWAQKGESRNLGQVDLSNENVIIYETLLVWRRMTLFEATKSTKSERGV